MYPGAHLSIDDFVGIGIIAKDALLIDVYIFIIIIVENDEVVYEGEEEGENLFFAEVLLELQALVVYLL